MSESVIAIETNGSFFDEPHEFDFGIRSVRWTAGAKRKWPRRVLDAPR